MVLEKGYHLDSPRPSAQLDFDRIRAGNLGAQFFSIWVPRKANRPGRALRYAWKVHRRFLEEVERSRGLLVVADTAATIRRARASGKVAALFGLEGAHALEGSIEPLAALRRAGVRYLSLTWNVDNPFATSADSAAKRRRDRGLTRRGRALIARMEALGIVPDLSHASPQTFWDTYAIARGPIIASHSNAKALRTHPRNLDDEQLRAIGRTGGVVGINFHAPFVRAGGGVSIEDVVDQAEYLVRIAGEDHVALGADFDANIVTPRGLPDVSALPRLTRALLARGLTTTAVRKLLGENVLRVLEASERLAAGPAGGEAPSRPIPLAMKRVSGPRAVRRAFDRSSITAWRIRRHARAVIDVRGVPRTLRLDGACSARPRQHIRPAGAVERVTLWLRSTGRAGRRRKPMWQEDIPLRDSPRREVTLPRLPSRAKRFRLGIEVSAAVPGACLTELTAYGITRELP